MDEKEITQEESEDTTGNHGEGDKSEVDEKVEQLNADTERINQAIAENENAKARQKLSGVAEAGRPTEKPKEETPAEYAKEIMSGKNE